MHVSDTVSELTQFECLYNCVLLDLGEARGAPESCRRHARGRPVVLEGRWALDVNFDDGSWSRLLGHNLRHPAQVTHAIPFA